MSIIRPQLPAHWPLESMWSQDLVDTAFGDMLRNLFGTDSLLGRVGRDAHTMRLEEFVEDGTCVIRAELPGMDPDEDIRISVEGGVLRLRATRQERAQAETPEGYRTEFRYGTLVRDVALPGGVSDAEVTATYRDGILEVRVPAPQEVASAPARRIPIDH